MPLAWAALGLALGISAGVLWTPQPLAVGLLLASLGGAWLLSRVAGLRLGFAALFAAALLLGVLRSGPDLLDPPALLTQYHDRDVTLTGTVHGLPERAGNRVRFDVRVEQLSADGASAAAGAAVLVWSDHLPPLDGRSDPYLLHGDRVTLHGRLEAPRRIGGFDYPEHLAAQGIGSILSTAEVIGTVPANGMQPMAAVHILRRTLAEAIAANVPEPQAALTQALLLGMRGGMPADASEAFRRAGMAHLLAVSGMHVGLVLGISLLASAAVIGRHRQVYLLPPLLLLWTYVLLAGAPPSAVRAAAMGSVFLLALATGRASASLNALGLAALVMLALEPRVLWDRSFQLSFSAMAGVLAMGLPLWSWVSPLFDTWRRTGLSWLAMTAARWLAAAALISVGATLGSLALVAFNFQQVPLLGIPATLIALPVLPLLLVSGGLAAAAGALLPPLAPVAAWLPTLFGWLVVMDATTFAAVPWAALDTQFVETYHVWLYYAAGLVLFAVAYRRRWLPTFSSLALALWRGPAQPVHAALVVAAFLLIAAAPWSTAVSRPDGHLHLHFLDVGQGDATLVRTPAGASILIDGGPDPRVTLRRLDAVLPATKPVIDVAVLTHPHADHMNGLLELARRGRIERVLVPPLLPGADDAWLAVLERSAAEVREVTAGALVVLEDGVRLEVLHPPRPLMAGTSSDIDNNSIALRMVYGGSAALFTGDLFAAGEHVLIRSGAELAAQVLKLGHHGSDTSTTKELLDAVRPSVAVASAGGFERFGHPSPEVLERALQYVPEGQLFETHRQGTVSLATDGSSRWWARTER